MPGGMKNVIEITGVKGPVLSGAVFLYFSYATIQGWLRSTQNHRFDTAFAGVVAYFNERVLKIDQKG